MMMSSRIISAPSSAAIRSTRILSSFATRYCLPPVFTKAYMASILYLSARGCLRRRTRRDSRSFSLMRAESKNIPLWNPKADCAGIYASRRLCQDRNRPFGVGFQPITYSLSPAVTGMSVPVIWCGAATSMQGCPVRPLSRPRTSHPATGHAGLPASPDATVILSRDALPPQSHQVPHPAQAHLKR